MLRMLNMKTHLAGYSRQDSAEWSASATGLTLSQLNPSKPTFPLSSKFILKSTIVKHP